LESLHVSAVYPSKWRLDFGGAFQNPNRANLSLLRIPPFSDVSLSWTRWIPPTLTLQRPGGSASQEEAPDQRGGAKNDRQRREIRHDPSSERAPKVAPAVAPVRTKRWISAAVRKAMTEAASGDGRRHQRSRAWLRRKTRGIGFRSRD